MLKALNLRIRIDVTLLCTLGLAACGKSSNNAAEQTVDSTTSGTGGSSSATSAGGADGGTVTASSTGEATTSMSPCAKSLALFSSETQLADFEDAASAAAYSLQTAVSGGAYGYYDQGDTGAEFTLEIVSPGHESNKALRLGVASASTWGAGLGLWFFCLDASVFSGISFWARGTSPQQIIEVTLGMPETEPESTGGTCREEDGPCTAPLASLEISEDWSLVSLAWTDFRNGSSGAEVVPANGRNLTGVNVHVVHDSTPMTDLELVVDDFQFTHDASEGGAAGAGGD